MSVREFRFGSSKKSIQIRTHPTWFPVAFDALNWVD